MVNSVFSYDEFVISADKKEVSFYFTITKDSERHSFTETFRFDTALIDCLETYRLLRALHLASGISYYKIFVSQEIEHPYAMSTREADFWNTVFRKGLGEFLLVNKLQPSELALFGPQEGHDTQNTSRATLSPKVLLGIGGGKDSIVAGELLKSLDLPVSGFVLATGSATGQTHEVAKIMKINMHTIERTVDSSLILLQERPDAYKGHIPVSVLFALTGCMLAVSTRSSYVVVANESSTSIPRAEWAGESVNHQWSKSFDFEKMLQAYINDYVSSQLVYFSAIRPLSSVAVSKIFCKYPEYFESYTSDNYAFRVDPNKRPDGRWSLESPKTLSSFILMSAWLSEDQLVAMFGRNFLNEPSLEPLFLSLIGIEGELPLDCVGTPEELRASLGQAYKHGTCIDSVLMGVAEKYEIVANDRTIAPIAEKFLGVADEQAFPDALAHALTIKIKEALS